MKVVLFVLLIAASALSAPDTKHACLRAALGLSSSALSQARGEYDIRNMLTHFTALPEATQNAISACNLNLKPATQRCEAAHPGQCEQISPAAIQIKCDSRFRRVGCCHCAMHCPSNSWKEDEYHCYKPETTESLVFLNQISCGANCEELAGKWVARCGEGYKRVGLRHCVAICPFGWHDEGARCRKPAVYRLTQPFFWAHGDN